MWAFPSPGGSAASRAGRRRAIPRCLESLDRLLALAPMGPRRGLSAPELTAQAIRRTGLDDFGDGTYLEPLQVLTGSYEAEANLSAFGRFAARWDVIRFLSNLLMLRRAEEHDPAILGEPIDRPIFITGLPRSATTFLHNLFCQDPANLAVRCWETIHPCADEARGAPKVDRHLHAFAWLAPEIHRIHPMTASSPQECTEITAHVFRSLRFDTTHHVPSYRRWLNEAGHLAAYRFHRRFLQHLQRRRRRGRWILKSPDHVFALDAIRAIYPDACLVFVHRNPSDVLASVAELTEVLRRPFTRAVDRHQIASQVNEHWAHGADILVAEAKNDRDQSRLAHLTFDRVVREPIGTLSALYDQFGLTFSEDVATRARRFIAGWPNGYRRDEPLLEEYRLAAESGLARYRDYRACFGV